MTNDEADYLIDKHFIKDIENEIIGGIIGDGETVIMGDKGNEQSISITDWDKYLIRLESQMNKIDFEIIKAANDYFYNIEPMEKYTLKEDLNELRLCFKALFKHLINWLKSCISR